MEHDPEGIEAALQRHDAHHTYRGLCGGCWKGSEAICNGCGRCLTSCCGSRRAVRARQERAK